MDYKLEIYAPENYIDRIKNALFSVGAGKTGNDKSAIAIIKTSGYWKPLKKSTPFQGQKDTLNYGEEVRLDIRCKDKYVKKALIAVKNVHPYEEPLINIVRLSNHEFE